MTEHETPSTSSHVPQNPQNKMLACQIRSPENTKNLPDLEASLLECLLSDGKWNDYLLYDFHMDRWITPNIKSLIYSIRTSPMGYQLSGDTGSTIKEQWGTHPCWLLHVTHEYLLHRLSARTDGRAACLLPTLVGYIQQHIRK